MSSARRCYHLDEFLHGALGWKPRPSGFLDHAVESVAATRMSPGLFAGFSGVAWAMAHFEGRLLDPAGEDPCEAIDTALTAHLGRSPLAW